MAKQLYHTRRIPVRGGIPMRGPTTNSLREARPTVVLSTRDLGKRLTLAGLAGDTNLGKRIQVLRNKPLVGRPVNRLAATHGRMLPGLGGGFLPGLNGDRGFMPGLGGGEVRDRLGRAIKHTQTRVIVGPRTRSLAAARGKMLPGLADDSDGDIYSLGYLSAANLYDQVDGLGGYSMNMWSGMPTPAMSAPGVSGIDLPVIGELTLPKIIAGAALFAFFAMSRRRYA